MRLIKPKQMREAERLSHERGMSYAMLADKAGAALADFIDNCEKDGSVLFLCGNGNNACDGFVAAELLSKRGRSVSVALLCGEPKTDIARAAYEKLLHSHAKLIALSEAECALRETDGAVVDCVFGTGFHGSLPDDIAKLFAVSTKAVRIAADIPSGADGLTGRVAGACFRADYTLAFGAEKTGTQQYPAKEFCGELFIADIGLSEDIFAELSPLPYLLDVISVPRLPERRRDSHKGSFGRLLCVCGSRDMTGACVLSARAAMKCGAGLVTVASVAEAVSAVSLLLPEATHITLDETADGMLSRGSFTRIFDAARGASAVLIGCGLGVSEDTRYIVRELLSSLECPIILDADGINCISDSIDIIKASQADILLTPHPGEMARLTGKTTALVQENRIECAEEFARENGCTVLLKGAATILAGNGVLAVNPTGNPGMSRGGSGDVLAGMAAAFAAQGMGIADAAALAAFLHGYAGDLAAQRLTEYAMLPSDIIDCLPEAFKALYG